ncbi:hypothetical protein ACOMHN_056962 [Nucella lapillus]
MKYRETLADAEEEFRFVADVQRVLAEFPDMPDVIPASGLSPDRQDYLYRNTQSFLDQPQNVLLVSNELFDGPPGKVIWPSLQSPFVQRSVVSGNATFLTVTVLPAIVADLTRSYQCEIQSFAHKGVILTQGVNINKSSIVVQAGAYPGHVNLSSSLTQLSGNKTVIELNCQATAAGLVLNGMKSVSDYVFQYNQRDNWITITQADPSRRGMKLGPTVTEGVFLKRAYRLSLALKSIPTCCRRYRCYLSFHGREFKELAAERHVCLSPGQGNCNQNGGSPRGEILNIVIALSLGFLCHFVYICDIVT